MKKRIEIEFDGVDAKGFTDKQINELNRVLMRAIHQIHEFANPKKVSIDGNVFWLRTSQMSQEPKSSYPVHHEEHIVMTTPSRLRK